MSTGRNPLRVVDIYIKLQAALEKQEYQFRQFIMYSFIHGDHSVSNTTYKYELL